MEIHAATSLAANCVLLLGRWREGITNHHKVIEYLRPYESL